MTEEKPNTTHQYHANGGHASHRHQHDHKHRNNSMTMDNKRFSSRQKRKIIARTLFTILSILAIIMMCFVVWIYTIE